MEETIATSADDEAAAIRLSSGASSESKTHSYFVRTADHERLKAAWWATKVTPTFSLLVADTLQTEADRLEREHNGGELFPPAPASARGRSSHEQNSGFRNHGYFFAAAVHERLKAAWWQTRDEGVSFSSLVQRLIAERVDRLEREHNGGEPFPPAPRGARGVDPEAARRQSEKLTSLWRQRREN